MQHCDFVAWREGEIFHQMVELDSDFIDSAIHDVEPFIKLAILPELVGKQATNNATAVIKQYSC